MVPCPALQELQSVINVRRMCPSLLKGCKRPVPRTLAFKKLLRRDQKCSEQTASPINLAEVRNESSEGS